MPKKEKFILAWQDENGDKHWEVGTNAAIEELDSRIGDRAPVAISYKARVVGTMYSPGVHARMRKVLKVKGEWF